MLNTDNCTIFLPIFPFQILFQVREKSKSFEGFFRREKIFCKTYARVTKSANSSYFLIFLPSLKPIFHLVTLFARREAKTRIRQRDWLKLVGEKIRREKVEIVPTFLSCSCEQIRQVENGLYWLKLQQKYVSQ